MKSAAREAYGSKRVEESIRIHEQGHRAASSDSVEITLTVGCTCATLGVIMTQLLLELRAAVLVPPLVLLLAFLVSTLALLAKLASRDLEHFERERETWELENFPAGEEREMVELFEAKGYSPEQSKQVVAILASRKKAFVEFMMVEELGILPSPSLASIWLQICIAFASILVAGFLPLLLMSMFSVAVSRVICAVIVFACGVIWSRATVYSAVRFGLVNLAVAIGAFGIARFFT